jgi:hypothetical protein
VWRQSVFNAAELADPLVSGSLAAPFGDGVANILRYAFEVPAGASAASYMPKLHATPASYGIDFPFESGRDDLIVIAESSDELDDWSGATVLFDSSTDFPPMADAFGRISIPDPHPPGDRRFYRVRVIEK